MKTHRLLTIAIAAGLFLLVSGVALAFAMGNVDGVWGYVEGGGDDSATCDVWATGPGDNPTAYNNTNTSGQGAAGGTDENQVRYGDPANANCPDGDNWKSEFAQQSGFGFDGVNNAGNPLPVLPSAFVLGRFTHYNNPIVAANKLDWVDLNITVAGITCTDGSTPAQGSTLTFAYRFNLDETPNQSPCAYSPVTPSNNYCPDKVTIGGGPVPVTFTCTGLEYTLLIKGFQPVSSPDGCAGLTYDANAITDGFVTQEGADNNACLWAQIIEYNPNSVDLVSFTATGGESSVAVAWETASEVDNVGFNIYRAEGTADGARVKLNDSLIPAQAMGSVMGASYSYTDSAVVRGVTYYYWLEDVAADGTSTLHGPAVASLIEAGSPVVVEPPVLERPVFERPVRELPVIELPARELPGVLLPVEQMPIVVIPGTGTPILVPAPVLPAPIVPPVLPGLPVERGMQ